MGLNSFHSYSLYVLKMNQKCSFNMPNGTQDTSSKNDVFAEDAQVGREEEEEKE